MAHATVGVDIGSRTVTVAELRSWHGRLIVTNFGGVDLPADVSRDGEILDVDGVAAIVRRLLSSAGIRRRKVWLGLAHPEVRVVEIEVPWMPFDQVRSALRYHATERLDLPLEDAATDAVLLGETTGSRGDRQLRVLLAAAPRTAVDGLTRTASRARLKPLGIDVAMLAALRVLGTESQLTPGDEVVIDLGAATTGIVAHRGRIPTAIRTLPLGGDAVTGAIADAMAIDFSRAEQAKRSATVGGYAGVVERIVTERTQALVERIRTTFDEIRSRGRTLGNVVLTGGCAVQEGLVEVLESALGLPVEVGLPFDHLAVRTSYDDEALARVGPSLTTAIGLAMGGFE